jgi:hypothetical protein
MNARISGIITNSRKTSTTETLSKKVMPSAEGVSANKR